MVDNMKIICDHYSSYDRYEFHKRIMYQQWFNAVRSIEMAKLLLPFQKTPQTGNTDCTKISNPNYQGVGCWASNNPELLDFYLSIGLKKFKYIENGINYKTKNLTKEKIDVLLKHDVHSGVIDDPNCSNDLKLYLIEKGVKPDKGILEKISFRNKEEYKLLSQFDIGHNVQIKAMKKDIIRLIKQDDVKTIEEYYLERYGIEPFDIRLRELSIREIYEWHNKNKRQRHYWIVSTLEYFIRTKNITHVIYCIKRGFTIYHDIIIPLVRLSINKCSKELTELLLEKNIDLTVHDEDKNDISTIIYDKNLSLPKKEICKLYIKEYEKQSGYKNEDETFSNEVIELKDTISRLEAEKGALQLMLSQKDEIIRNLEMKMIIVSQNRT